MSESTDAPSPAGATSQEGSKPVLAALIEGHDEVLLDQLYGYILRRVSGDEDAANDVYVDTLRATLTYTDRVDLAESEIPALMFGIARNMIADWWAWSRKCRSGLTEPSDMALLTGAVVTPFRDVDRRIDVERALSKLAARQREALVLTYIDQLGRPLAAAMMKISVDGVERLLKKGKKNLRQLGMLDGHQTSPSTRRHPQTGTTEAQA